MEVNEDMTIEVCLLRVKKTRTNLCAKYEYPNNFILAKIFVVPLIFASLKNTYLCPNVFQMNSE